MAGQWVWSPTNLIRKQVQTYMTLSYSYFALNCWNRNVELGALASFPGSSPAFVGGEEPGNEAKRSQVLAPPCNKDVVFSDHPQI